MFDKYIRVQVEAFLRLKYGRNSNTKPFEFE